MPKPPTGGDRATARLEAAIARHAGWQLEYDMAVVVYDRKRLIARIAELTAYVEDLELVLADATRMPRTDINQYLKSHEMQTRLETLRARAGN